MDQQEMSCTHHDKPGHQRTVLHRIPCPETAETQGFIGPCTAHQNARSQDHHTEKGPGQSRLQPFVVAARPQSSHSKCKGDQCTGKAEEGDRRMDRHPVILKQWIQSFPVHEGRDALEVIGQLCPGQSYVFRQLADQYERTASNAETKGMDAKHHADQKDLYQTDHRHDRCLPVFGRTHQHPTENDMPDRPKDETPLLPFPKGREDVSQRKVER